MKVIPMPMVDAVRVVAPAKDRVLADRDRVVGQVEVEVGVVEEISLAPDPVATAFVPSVVIKYRMLLASVAMTKPVLNVAPG